MKNVSSDIAFRTLFVSFSVILLGIFIFLNAFAVPDQTRLASAVDSIERTFASDSLGRSKRRKQDGVLLPSDIRQMFSKKSQVETIGAIEAMIEGGRLSSERADDGFHIFIPTQELFVARDVQVRAEFVPIVSMIAEYCKTAELACEVRVNEHLSKDEFDLQSLEIGTRYAQALFRLFLDRGVDPEEVDAFARQITPTADKENKTKNAQFRIYRRSNRGAA